MPVNELLKSLLRREFIAADAIVYGTPGIDRGEGVALASTVALSVQAPRAGS